jgi:hypothetical protein
MAVWEAQYISLSKLRAILLLQGIEMKKSIFYAAAAGTMVSMMN